MNHIFYKSSVIYIYSGGELIVRVRDMKFSESYPKACQNAERHTTPSDTFRETIPRSEQKLGVTSK